MAVEGAGAKLIPVGPPNRYRRWPPTPTSRMGVQAVRRGARTSGLDKRVKIGGMNEFHAAAKEADTKVVTF